ncbi:alpha/beta hydrolase [Phenylobacterium sp.]|uniref:alpha/beta hydrolase n=1 Tax=Phenylobacterium sp. TaxID=1871053 RepID=UPI002730DC33|nr:alpha/beta fold hydrolase [Phenylobacterium sp.]MDP1616646.1 alpha/beta fold hydrolase [Phenylobacterium sp.]MDP1988105.1 alpha/beta fold hydrolase [Phenylobacterium sp.]
MLKFIALGLGVLLVAWIGLGLAIEAAFAPKSLRGEMVNLGDRRLRLVCEGPETGPLVWLEAGAFGFSADFADLQATLAREGFRACAYDRAGLGFSDPGPWPRDSEAIVSDLDQLMTQAGVTRPAILVGHSMGGQHVRLFAVRHPERVAGVVLLDAATPEAVEIPMVWRFVATFGRLSQGVALLTSAGLAKPLFFLGDRIGLSGPAVREKQAAFVSGRHARNAANEAAHWLESARMTRAAGQLDPAWPVAVVTAGPSARIRDSAWADARLAPVEASQHGSYAAVSAAGHATLLSHAHNAEIVAAVKRVSASLDQTPANGAAN